MPLLKPNAGRALSAIGAVVVTCALFMTWYHIVRPTGATQDSTGWQTFTNLRVAILAGAILTLGSAAVVQTRPILIARTLLGLVLAALIVRRIVSPPDVTGTLSDQVGVYVGAIGALLVAVGGLVDTGRQVVEAYPTLWRQPVAQIERGGPSALDRGDE